MVNEEKIGSQDFLNLLQLKCSLYYYNVDDFIELCKDEKQYATFLDSALLLTEYDEGFLRLDSEFLEKISRVIEEYRFIYTDSSYNPGVNDMICRLNVIKSDSSKLADAKMEHYLCWQEDSRDVYFTDLDDFISTMADDYFVYQKFLSGYDQKISDVTIYSSLNYFAAMCPQVFLDSNFYQSSMDYLDGQANRHLIRKNHKMAAIRARDNIQKIKKGLN